MTRVNSLPENTLPEELLQLRRTVDELRTAQKFGSSNIRTYVIRNETSNIDITLAGLTTSTTARCVLVTLTPDNPSLNPAVAYDCAMRITASGGGGSAFINLLPLVPAAGVQQFRLYVKAATTSITDLSCRFSFWTVSPATYTYEEVAP